MADRTIKPDDTHDLVIQNNHGASKIEVNEDDTVVVTSGGNFTVDATGDIILDAGGADVTLKDGGTTYGILKQVSGDLVIQPTTSKQIILNEDGGTAALTIDTEGDLIVAGLIKQADGKKIETDEVRARDGDGLKLYDDAGNGIFIADGGNVGIGTSSPGDRKLSVNTSVADFAMSIYNTLGSSSGQGIIIYAGVDGAAGGAHISFRSPDGTTLGSISQDSGSSVNYSDSSDYRLKENVIPLTGAIDRINQLKPSRFNFILDPETTLDGFIAHEVSEFIPEAITGEKDAVDENGEIEPQGIDKSKLVPLLVASVQELSTKVTALENA